MPCPICDHTMQNLGVSGRSRLFWCPRCGTIQDEEPGPAGTTEVPRLVMRVRVADAGATYAGIGQVAIGREHWRAMLEAVGF